MSCLGPIVCRVVTCTPPWEFDPTCTTATATDNNTRWHHRPCLERPTPARGSLPATFKDGVWTLGYRLSSSSWVPLETFTFGQAGDIPVMGDWNGDGTHTVGVVRGNRWLLRNSNTAGNADVDFVFGKVGDIPVVGDWEGRGRTGIGVRRGTRNRWNLRHTASGGSPQIRIRFGRAGDTPVTGDWNGDGRTGIGTVQRNARPPGNGPTARWFLRQTATTGRAERHFYFGKEGQQFVVGNWHGDDVDHPGLVNPGGRWRWRTANSNRMNFGGSDSIPLIWQAGDWTPGRLP